MPKNKKKTTFLFGCMLPVTIPCKSAEYIATISAQIHLLLVLSMRGWITHISRTLNIPTRGEGKKEGDWVIPKMNVPRSFWANNTKPAKGNIGIIWWGIPNVSGGLNCQGLNDKYMLLVVESDSTDCPEVLCGCQHHSICPWRCWLKVLSSAWVVFCALCVCTVQTIFLFSQSWSW